MHTATEGSIGQYMKEANRFTLQACVLGKV